VRVLFPSDSPGHATGPGAIVWSASASCPGGAGARVAPLGAGDEPGESAVPHTATGRSLAPLGPLVATDGPHGQIVISGGSPQPSAAGLLIQGAAGGSFTDLAAAEGSSTPMALATAYLGDVAFAARARAGEELHVHVERFFAHRFAAGTLVSDLGAGPIQRLVTTMDYRGETLVVWAQGGALYARLVPANGSPRAVQRLASVGADPNITALVSDDRRAIVAWAQQRGSETSVYVDRSAAGVRFGAPELLERFQDPDGLSAPGASPTLVRLSSESVVLAWAGAAGGHWVVRTAPVDLNGIGEVSTIATPGADALLAGLAAGPVDDALVLWTEPSPSAGGAPDQAREALYAAHGFSVYPPARTVFGEAELLAPPAHVSEANVAFDPDTDGAIAAWQGEAGEIEYSIRK
jgi:hypothetical protein